MTIQEKNYSALINKAEKAFSEKKYLEAFLIQSCLVESMVKSFAFLSLRPILESHPELKSKSSGFELARLSDELFMVGKINHSLYENLNKYRRKRNQVIHHILKFTDAKIFEKELKEAYKVGKKMQSFLVEEMLLKKKGKTASELVAKFEQDAKIYVAEVREATKPFFRKLNRDMAKLGLKVEKTNLKG